MKQVFILMSTLHTLPKNYFILFTLYLVILLKSHYTFPFSILGMEKTGHRVSEMHWCMKYSPAPYHFEHLLVFRICNAAAFLSFASVKPASWIVVGSSLLAETFMRCETHTVTCLCDFWQFSLFQNMDTCLLTETNFQQMGQILKRHLKGLAVTI